MQVDRSGSKVSLDTESDRSLFRAAAVCFAGVAIALAVSGQTDLVNQATKRVVTDASFVVFSTLAAVACFRAARLGAPGRRFPWVMMGCAATCYAIGNSTWFYYQVIAPETQTFPGPADIFYVAVAPFAVAAMLTLPSHRLSPEARARAIADAAIVAAALLFISWILVVGPLLDQLGQVSWVYLGVYLYYPLTDIVIISIASGLAARAVGRGRGPLLLVAVGFVAIAAADTGISYLALQGRDAAGSGLDLGWSFGYMLLALAALAPREEPRPDDRFDHRSMTRELVPYVPVAVVVVIRASTPSLRGDAVLASILLAVIVLVIVRHTLTLADNIRLTRNLEDQVDRRTKELEQLTRRNQSILNGAGEGIVGLDRQGMVDFANPATAKLLGRPVEDLVGRSFRDVTQPRDAEGVSVPEALDPVIAALEDGQQRVAREGTYRRRDGVDFAVELTVAPLHAGEGSAGAVVLFRDITERRAIERMKDEFVSVVSHELRTPLTSVRGALGLLQGGMLRDAPPKAQRMIQIAVESTDRLVRLINDILDVERVAAGKLTVHRQFCSVADLIHRAVAEMRGYAVESGVNLRVGPVSGHSDVDPDRIVQTLTNLISNAIKFSPPGGTVHVDAARRNGEVLVTVSDEGRGIPPDLLETVFSRFAQVDASDTREKEGTGLGLAICRGIVEHHGGRIWAQNKPEKGAIFSFTLPAVEAPAELAALPGGQVLPDVLVCEEDPQTRVALSVLLGSHGYAVTGAATGEEALALAFEQPPVAVLMDIATVGWSTIAALHADARTRDVAVLIIAGADPGPVPADVAAMLTKPLDVGALLGTLNDIGEVNDAIEGGAGRPCVLVVEDDPGLAHVLSSLFSEHGVWAVTAHTARDALRLSRDLAPDLLLLDLLLPDSDGFHLVDWLREDPRLCRVPLVVYSALELDEEDRQRLQLGPTEFYTKARTNPEEIEQYVVQLLDMLVTGARR